MEPVFSPNLHRTTNRDLVLQPATCSDRYRGSDDAIRTNDHIRTNLGSRIHHGGRMNAHWWRNANINVPSEVTSPLTRHRQLAFPICPFALKSSASIISMSPGTTGFRNLTPSALRK